MGLQDNKMSKNVHRLRLSFEYAYMGLKHTFLSENNFQIELIVAVCVLILSSLLKISKNDWLIVLFCIGLVLAFELMNTAIEAVVDLMTNGQFHPLAKVAKDCAASAVLCISICVCIIGIYVFMPYIVNIF